MRVVFLGSGAFGVPTLGALAREHEVVGVVTQPDRRAGRGKTLTPTPIAAWADEHLGGVPVLKPENVNEESERARVRALDADVWVVIAFGQYLGSRLIEGKFAVNLHASLLPRWRGAAPINAAMMAGDRVTGNSVITIAEEMDAGDVLARSERVIEPDMTMHELHDALAEDGPVLVLAVLDEHASGSVEYAPQDASGVTLAPKLSRADTWVDFGSDARLVAGRVNGLSPRPGVRVRLGGKVHKLVRVVAVEDAQGDTGCLVDAGSGVIACGLGGVRVLEIQPEGKKAMGWDAFRAGNAVEAGEIVESETRIPVG